jgi:magnesium transporter
LRWHFWHIRDVINFLTHVHEDRQDIKYLKIVYDDINQLIELVESYQDTVNSNRELYIVNVSFQMSDTVKTPTIFFCNIVAADVHFQRVQHEWT